MKRGWMVWACLAACPPVWGAESPPAKLIDESRAAVAQLMKRVGGELRREMEFSGPSRSIMVCKYASQDAAAELSRKSGWRISRVSLKPRNPLTGVPDAWEQQALVEFDRRAASGEKPETIERAEIVVEPLGRYFRYAKALPVAPPCLECHGPIDQLAAAVRARLASEYPYDPATGYSVGQLRGAVSIKRPLP